MSAKRFIVGLVIGVALIAPTFSWAQTAGNSGLIQQLRQQIVALQAQIAALLEQGGGQTWCHDFNNNLQIGNGGQAGGTRQANQIDKDVVALILALSKEGLLDYNQTVQPATAGSSIKASFFSEKVAAVVTGFQEKYRDEILTPNGLAHGTGFVGRATRAKLNQLYGCGGTTSAPHISSMYPQSGPVGTQVTVTGSGFLPTNNFVKFGPVILMNVSANVSSLNRRTLGLDTLVFNVPSRLDTGVQGSFSLPISPGTYNVSVSNSNGTSNTATFTVTAGTSQSAIPIISSINPSSGSIGTRVTITGSGFSSTGNAIKFDRGFIGEGYNFSSNGTTITFTLPDQLVPCSPAENPCVRGSFVGVYPGTYQISVQNANGMSNTVTFTVTSGTPVS